MLIWVYFCKILFPSSSKNITCNNAFDRDFDLFVIFDLMSLKWWKLTLDQHYLSILDPILI